MTRFPTILVALVLGLAVPACSSDDDTGSRADARPTDDGAPGDAASDDATDASNPGDDTASVDPNLVFTDPVARLQWQRVPPDDQTVTEAYTYCEENQAGLPGLGWHLPSIDELRTLIVGCPAVAADGECGVTEACLSLADCWTNACWSCPLGEGPADGCYRPADLEGDCAAYWSLDPVQDQGGRGWFVNFRRGGVHHDLVENPSGVRCVRWY